LFIPDKTSLKKCIECDIVQSDKIDTCACYAC